jgi:hypothetical protein
MKRDLTERIEESQVVFNITRLLPSLPRSFLFGNLRQEPCHEDPGNYKSFVPPFFNGIDHTLGLTGTSVLIFRTNTYYLGKVKNVSQINMHKSVFF